MFRLAELLEIERLVAVAQRLLRVRMNLDDQPVGAGGDPGAGDGRDVLPPTGAVARIEEHGQMRELFDDRDGVDVGGVTRGLIEGADAAFAQDHLAVSLDQDVLGRHQPLFDGRHHAAFEQHRARRFTGRPQQGIVLHVARTHLDDVGVAGDDGHLLRREGFRHDRETGRLPGFCQQLQTFFAQTLEAVRGGARLECTAA